MDYELELLDELEELPEDNELDEELEAGDALCSLLALSFAAATTVWLAALARLVVIVSCSRFAARRLSGRVCETSWLQRVFLYFHSSNDSLRIAASLWPLSRFQRTMACA